MKRLNCLLFALVFALQLVATTAVRAETLLSPSIVINEIQTNGPITGTSSHEFIELKNISDIAYDISNWRLNYTPSSGLATSSKTIIIFTEATVIYPGGYLLIASPDYVTSVTPKIIYPSTTTASTMASTGGSVALVNAIAVTVDLVGWGTAATNLRETDLVPAPKNGQSIQRKMVNEKTTDTDNNNSDFEELITPTPEATNTSTVHPDEVPVVDPDPELPAESPPEEVPTVPTETEPPEDTPEPITEEPIIAEPTPETPAYLPVLINELYIDPNSPETDANDEWIELYNPNDTAVDISGYTIYAGTNFTYRHIFPAGSSIAAKSFAVVSSANTTLAFSNGGGAAKIVSPNGEEFDATTYIEAEEGQAWAKSSNGLWEWTTTPTEDSVNIITVPLPAVLKAAAVSVAKAKKAPKATTKKTTVKAATTKATKAKTASGSSFSEPALISAPTPIPGWLLAVLMALALLYVTYEYRFEVANTIYKLRSNRGTRH